jgi:hypothetical protein
MKTMVATRPTNTSTHSHQAMGSMLRRSAEVLGGEADPLPVGVYAQGALRADREGG